MELTQVVITLCVFGKAVNTWLTSKKTDELEQWYKKYINHVTSSEETPAANLNSWTDLERNWFKTRCSRHRRYLVFASLVLNYT